MTIQKSHDFKPCVPGAFKGGLSRTLFFDGMVLSEDDLMREQSYWRMKRQLTNRALGQGVVWGLGVVWDPDSRCFTICPGYGLSCCGDDLVVECPEKVCERELIDPCSEDFRRLLSNRFDLCEDDPRPDRNVEACLMLEYVECPEDPRRVFEDPCAQQAKGCRFGAVRETTRLRLVPPPLPCPGPIERFCRHISEIREQLDASGISMPEPDFSFGLAESGVSVTHFAADGSALGGDRVSIAAEQGATAEARHNRPDGVDSVRIGIEPPLGHIIVRATIDGVERPVADTMMGVFMSRPINAAVPLPANIEIETAPLLGGIGARTVYLFTPGTTEIEDSARAEVLEREELPRRADCASLLADGLLLACADASCTLRTLALALVCGWVTGTVAPAPCAGEDEAEPSAAHQLAAWTICRLAWELLFGIDITNPQAAGVQKCLRRLFAEWCDGFRYKGPRCDENAHGIILGCVDLTPRGRIVCFHEGRHRRYVLTGPLLSHWAGQFGLAPIDVVAGRFGDWICCVAGAPVSDYSTSAGAAAAAIIPAGEGAVAYGASYANAARIEGVQVARRREVGATEFAAEAMNQMISGRRTSLATATSVEVVSAPSLGLHLVRPVEGAAAAVEAPVADQLKSELSVNVRDMPPMARQPMTDFVAKIAESVPVTALKPQTESRLTEPTLAALEKAGVTNLAELVEIGPEPAAARVRAELADNPDFAEPASVEKAMGMVYDAALKALSSTAEVIAEEARTRDVEAPFTRADLKENSVVNAVRTALNTNLKGRGLTVGAIRKAASDTQLMAR